MDTIITRIENTCLDFAIDFCISGDLCSINSTCDYFTVVEFDPWGNQRTNNFYSFEWVNGGFGTCMTDTKKQISLKIQVLSDCIKTRTQLRKKLDLLFSNPSCCGDCCPIKIYFTDWDWEEYSFTAKAGSTTISDNFNNSILVSQTETVLEACSDFVNEDQKECCWILWSICGWQLPFRGCPKKIASKWIDYRWKGCGDYKVVIQAKMLKNPRFFNWDGYYWLNWEYNWELIIDTQEGVSLNGIRVSTLDRQDKSNMQSIKLWYWANEMLLTADWWEATYCIYWANNWN